MITVPGFEGKTIAVFGLARSGLAAAQALTAGGAQVVVWDDNASSRDRAAAQGFTLADLRDYDWSRLAAIMLSPGVPLTHPRPHWTVEKAQNAGVEILGDVELFARAINSLAPDQRPKVVAITGTNGKSTTTALIEHVCRALGRDTRIGGNFGFGVLGLEPPAPGAVYVLELSSYQLDLTSSLSPDVAILLNVSEDHLERHGDMSGYVAAKRRIFSCMGQQQTCIIGIDDDWARQICTEMTGAATTRVIPISARQVPGRGVFALSGMIYDGTGGRTEEVVTLADVPSLLGQHNWQNAAAAYAAAVALGLSGPQVAAALRSFPGLAHRMEVVRTLQGVRFVNDSKATNANAARQAMSSYQDFYWILGGQAKAGGIAPLRDLFPRVRKAYLIGEAATAFAAELGDDVPHELAVTLDVAVARAWGDARADVASCGADRAVLLSPACASFDQYPDFEVRGDAFRAAVMAIPENQTG